MSWRTLGLAALTLAAGLLALWLTLRVLEVDRQPPPRPKALDYREVLEQLRREVEREMRGGGADDEGGGERKSGGRNGFDALEGEAAEPRDGATDEGRTPEPVRPAARRPRRIYPLGDYPELRPRRLDGHEPRPQTWPEQGVPRVRVPGLIDEWRKAPR